MGGFDPLGVNPQLAWNVRNALDREGFGEVRIVASGGFDADKIRRFKELGVPVDSYGVGSSLMDRNVHYTADVVHVDGEAVAKVGRTFRPNPMLERVE